MEQFGKWRYENAIAVIPRLHAKIGVAVGDREILLIEAADFVAPAREQGFSWYAGVPCSFFTPLINHVIDGDGLTYVSAVNEGDAVAAACGAAIGARSPVTATSCGGSSAGAWPTCATSCRSTRRR